MQQIHLPTLSKTNKALVIILVGGFVLNAVVKAIFGAQLIALLGLSLVGMKSFLFYQIFTYPLISSGLMEVVFTGILLWFLGSELENMWGTKRYVVYLVLTALVSGVVYLIMSAFMPAMASYPIHGMGVFSSAMCVSYAVVYPNRTFQFFLLIPIQAKWFCLILAGMSLYTGVFTPGGASAWANLTAMGFGFIYLRLLLVPSFNRLFVKHTKKTARNTSKKSHLRIVKDDDERGSGPRYFQ